MSVRGLGMNVLHKRRFKRRGTSGAAPTVGTIVTARVMCSVKINSTKSMIGHLLGGASGVEGVATVMSVFKQRIHPNINLDDPEDEVDLTVLAGSEAIDTHLEVALSNSFGFGGHNSTVVFRRWQD